MRGSCERKLKYSMEELYEMYNGGLTLSEVGSVVDMTGVGIRSRFVKRRYKLKKNTEIQNLAGSVTSVQEALRERLGSVQMQPTQGFATQEDLKIRAENQFSTSLHGMRGSGVAEGNHRIQAQATIGIADVGGRFSNIWYLLEVRHILDKNGYRTEFDCQR